MTRKRVCNAVYRSIEPKTLVKANGQNNGFALEHAEANLTSAASPRHANVAGFLSVLLHLAPMPDFVRKPARGIKSCSPAYSAARRITSNDAMHTSDKPARGDVPHC